MISDKQEHTCAGMQGKKYGRFISSTVVDHSGGGACSSEMPNETCDSLGGRTISCIFLLQLVP